MQKYNINVLQYGETQYVSSNCNSITFLNTGGAIVLIQQSIQLANGQSFTVEGNERELCVQEFLVTFSGEGEQKCVIVKKNYVN